jgi:curved DNA-binding protein CbpA
MKNYYDILGISRDANAKAIKSSYRSLVKKYHPDVVKGNKLKGAKYFEEVTAAYNTLMHSEKRKAYDLKIDGTPASAVFIFPFRELKNWLSSFPIYKMIFSDKQVAKTAGEPMIRDLPVEELLQRIVYSKNSLLRIHSVRAVQKKESRYATHDLLRLLYTGINDDVKVEIIRGLKKPYETDTENILREIFRLEKSPAVRSAIREQIKI